MTKIVYCNNNNFNGKYWAIFGPKLSGQPAVSDYRVPDFRRINLRRGSDRVPDFRRINLRRGSVMPMRFSSIPFFQLGFGLAMTAVPKPKWSDPEHLQDQGDQVLMNKNHNPER